MCESVITQDSTHTASHLPRCTPHMFDGHSGLSLGITKPLDMFISPLISRYFRTAVVNEVWCGVLRTEKEKENGNEEEEVT